MGCRILQGEADGTSPAAVFYCSTTMQAFGPVMGSMEEAEKFLQWLPGDPRLLHQKELIAQHAAFVQQFICECGAVREDRCDYCDEGSALYLPKNAAGLHVEAEGGPAPLQPVECESEPAPPAGERYQCKSCCRYGTQSRGRG